MTRPLMLFAAGFGTRMGALTRALPKPLIPVAGKPLIDHALDHARDAGCDPIVANLHYLPGPLHSHLDPQGVRTITETPDILETGGGLRNALALLGDGPVTTSNTDAVWLGPNPIRALHDAWDPKRMDGLLMCVSPEQAEGHKGAGDFRLSRSGEITRGPGVIYCGVQIIKTDLLATVEEKSFSLNVIWDRMIAKGRLFGLRYTGRWCDVGHADSIAVAEAMLRSAHV